MSLGRSFGLMPANRGVVSTGLYRIVRHPIYIGYLITHVGFVLANPAIWNLLLLVAADIALLLRAVCEERTLARDAAYSNVPAAGQVAGRAGGLLRLGANLRVASQSRHEKPPPCGLGVSLSN